MKSWLTSDMHFEHVNIIPYTGRPFATPEEMDEWIINTWNETVSPEDDVWVLGDAVLGKIAYSLTLIGRLNGHLRLLAGNHDRCWEGYGAKGEKWVQRYLDAGFDEILQGTIELEIDPRWYTIANHFPYVGDSQETDRYRKNRPIDQGAWLIHGHVHEKWRQRGRMINVGLDAWGGRPVSFETVAELIVAGPHDLERVAWVA